MEDSTVIRSLPVSSYANILSISKMQRLSGPEILLYGPRLMWLLMLEESTTLPNYWITIRYNSSKLIPTIQSGWVQLVWSISTFPKSFPMLSSRSSAGKSYLSSLWNQRKWLTMLGSPFTSTLWFTSMPTTMESARWTRRMSTCPQLFGGESDNTTPCGGRKTTTNWSSFTKRWKRLKKYFMLKWDKHFCTYANIQRIAADQTDGEGDLPTKKAGSPLGSNCRPEEIHTLAKTYLRTLRGVKVPGINSLCFVPWEDRRQMESSSSCQARGVIWAEETPERGLERDKGWPEAEVAVRHRGHHLCARKRVHWRGS